MNSLYRNFVEQHLYSLSTEFRFKVGVLIENCLKRGVIMYPMESLRHPLLQAKYWKQSRSEMEVSEKTKELRKSGAYFLADCITHAGDRSGPKITNSIPGLSWHQWGEAIDFVWIPKNKPVWDINVKIGKINGYQVYGEEAKKLDLECGLFWNEFVDAAHVQLRSAAHPGILYSINHINDVMEQRFH